MTGFADTFQLPLLSVEDGQCQIRSMLQVLHMVDDHSLLVPPFAFAALALPVIHFQNLVADALRLSSPLRPKIELMFPPLGDQLTELGKPIGRNQANTTQMTQAVPDDRNRLSDYFMLPV